MNERTHDIKCVYFLPNAARKATVNKNLITICFNFDILFELIL